MPRRRSLNPPILHAMSRFSGCILNRMGSKRLKFILSILTSPIDRMRFSPVLINQTMARRQVGEKRRGFDIDSRHGFTLIEVMIATAVTLLMMVGLAQMFKLLGDSMSQGRGGLELNNRLRSVIHRVRTDLDNVTAPARPPLPVGSGLGYMKYYEGPASDYTFASWPILNRYGDVDDIFMATVKAKDTWFTGKVPKFIAEKRAPTTDEQSVLTSVKQNGMYEDPQGKLPLVTIASQFAEVVIFARPYYQSTQSVNPDGFRLYYRALLIRPDLNVDGKLPYPYLSADAQNGTNIPQVAAIQQICDLSLRRVDHLANSAVAVNTLEDLANPANRFAHIVLPVPNQNAVTMPVLALGPTIPTIILSPPDEIDFQGPGTTLAGAGFLHEKFVLAGDRQGEDLLANDLLAFDVRAYDASAPILQLHEHDTGAGDHNHDDVTLRPGDPGYGIVAALDPDDFIAYGEFVDLNWAGKRSLSYQSELSGTTASGSVTDSLRKSGLVKADPNAGFQVFQPSYDTFTNLYEGDGVLQAELSGQRGLVTPTGNVTLHETWRSNIIDAGSDGVDNLNSSSGIDDPSELESSPPFPVAIRGLQVSIRLENRATKQFKQMSTIKEFVTP